MKSRLSETEDFYNQIPCYFDHNGECLVCDCWPPDCAWGRMLNKDYKYESKEELEKMFSDMESLKKKKEEHEAANKRQQILREKFKSLEDMGYTNLKNLPVKGICGIYKFICTTGLVLGISENGYTGRYCYTSESEAVKALQAWALKIVTDEIQTGQDWDGTGDPGGPWIKYKGEGGERSNPNIIYD